MCRERRSLHIFYGQGHTTCMVLAFLYILDGMLSAYPLVHSK